MKKPKLALLVSFAFLFFTCNTKQEYKFSFLDPDLSTEERVNDLVSRMTLDEKISQMMNQAPAIERLGVPEYNWWSEGLHGIARAGLATVFPQAIGLAASWDEQMMFNVSTVISDETRAKHHEFSRKNKRFLFQGLTLWSPTLIYSVIHVGVVDRKHMEKIRI